MEAFHLEDANGDVGRLRWARTPTVFTATFEAKKITKLIKGDYHINYASAKSWSSNGCGSRSLMDGTRGVRCAPDVQLHFFADWTISLPSLRRKREYSLTNRRAASAGVLTGVCGATPIEQLIQV
jgi:hypothetical protein